MSAPGANPCGDVKNAAGNAEPSAAKQTHFGDPCIHCGVPQMELEPGACQGDPSKAKVIGYASLGVRPDGVEHYRYRLSTNDVREAHRHVSEHAPYYHFGRSHDLIQPPPYDARLKAKATPQTQESEEG